jgi:hypothetical protein
MSVQRGPLARRFWPKEVKAGIEEKKKSLMNITHIKKATPSAAVQ